MKKSNLITAIILLFGLSLFVIPAIYPDSVLNPNYSTTNLVLIIMIILSLCILAVYFKFDEAELNTKDIAFIAIYGTFTAVARVPFVGLPSVQPCTYLIICAGAIFGPLVGFVVGGNVALISNFFLGQGPWTVYQIFAWGIVGAISGFLFKKRDKNPNKYVLAIYGFMWGFFYGWFMNSWSWLMFYRPLNWETFLAVNLSSVAFDLSHAIANSIFLFTFGDQTMNILRRFRNRFKILVKTDI